MSDGASRRLRMRLTVLFFVLCVLRPSIYFICIGLAVIFCGMYGDRRRVGLPTSRARARVRRLTPTDRYPGDSNPGPFDLKSSASRRLRLSLNAEANYFPTARLRSIRVRRPITAEYMADTGCSGRLVKAAPDWGGEG